MRSVSCSAAGSLTCLGPQNLSLFGRDSFSFGEVVGLKNTAFLFCLKDQIVLSTFGDQSCRISLMYWAEKNDYRICF